MKDTHKIILQTFAASKKPLTFHQAYRAMEPADKGKFTKESQVNGIVCALGGAGFLVSSQSTVIGETSLVWEITDKGIDAIKDNIKDKQVKNDVVDIEDKIEQYLAETLKPEVDTDQIEEFDQAVSVIRDAFLTALQPKKLPTIKDKEIILKTLGKLGALMSDDIGTILMQAAVFISQFESE
jgi:hypothetical protein